MPILIKSSNGQRSCKVMKGQDPLDKLLDSLKDLSFTIEIKITDIEKKDEEPEKKIEKVERKDQVPEKPVLPKKVVFPDNVDVPTKIGILKKMDVAANSEVPERKDEMVERKETLREDPAIAVGPPVISLETSKQNAVIGDSDKESSPPIKVPEVRDEVVERKDTLKKVPSVSPPAIPLGTVKENAVCTGSDEQSSPPFIYVPRDEELLHDITIAMQEITPSLEKMNHQPFGVGDLVFAKSTMDEEESWYRAKVVEIDSEGIKVLFIDWGLTEHVTKDRIRLLTHPDLSVTRFPPCAIKIRILDAQEDELKEICSGEKTFAIKFESYNPKEECYYVSQI